MKQPLLTTAALILIIISMVFPAEANPLHNVATTLVYHHSSQSNVSILVEASGNIGVDEASSLSNFGRVTTVAGRIAVLHTETWELPSVARLPFLSTVEQSWPLHVYLDKSVPDIGANAVWDQVRDAFGRNVTGNGVIIGFVDTGIDVSHPDFTFPNGTTKILYLWDQTISGRPPPAFGYGYECKSEDIQSAHCPENDTFGHGTHVAGIATSSGVATGNYTGVAPGANIIFVKSGNATCDGAGWTFDSSQILDGINYIVTKARLLGRRVVINLSLGGNIGGHDGSDPMEMALDQFVEAGTPIVVAAGNDGQDNIHIQGRFAKNGNVTFNIISHQTTTDLAIDIWYSRRDDIDATMTTWTGRTYTVSASTGEPTATYGNVTTLGRSSGLGNELYFEINSRNSLPTSNWSVTLEAKHVEPNDIWDAWVDTASCESPGASFLPGSGYSIDQNDTIGIPGTAHDVVTVGAYITKSSWKGLNGQTFGSTSTPTGGIASFSSRGPTRDGRTKPDVTAPGSVIASARSKEVMSNPSDPDQFHRILAGTSMAAPHVSGTIALMLQYSPNLQAVDIPSIIRETARQDPNTGLRTSGSPSWGFGKIDARTATGLIRLTLIVNGLPLGFELLVQIDGEELEATSNSWLYLYFPPKTTHIATATGSVSTTEGTQYELAYAELIVGTKAVQTPNHGIKTAIEYGPLNETEYLILNYEPTQAPNPFTLVLPSVVILALSIAVILLVFDLYLIRRGEGNHSTRTLNLHSLLSCLLVTRTFDPRIPTPNAPLSLMGNG